MKTLAGLYQDVKPIDLDADDNEYKFDSMLDRLCDEFELRQAFDDLVTALTELLDKGSIDSFAARR